MNMDAFGCMNVEFKSWFNLFNIYHMIVVISKGNNTILKGYHSNLPSLNNFELTFD